MPLLVSASPIYDKEGKLIGSVHLAKDISVQKKIQNDLTRRNLELDALGRLNRQAMRSQDLQGVIAAAFEGINEVCQPDLILFYKISGNFLELQGAFPPDAEEFNERKEIGECLCGLAASHGEPVYSSDIFCDTRCTLSECKKAGMHSFVALPLIHDKKTIGVIGIAYEIEKDFSTERDFLETMAASVGIITKNTLLLKALQNQTDALEQQVAERTLELKTNNAELERFNKLFVDREFRIKELRDLVAKLRKEK